MRCTRFSSLSMVVLTAALTAAGCGGSDSVTGPDDPASGGALGAAVIQGTVQGGGFAGSSSDFTALTGSGSLTVSVEGTSLSTTVDEEGEFILVEVPAGTVTLIFKGPGIDARVTVSGLVDGQVLSLECQVSGSNVEVTTPPHTGPSKKTKITGILREISGTQLRVEEHRVDASQVKKVWRGGNGTTLEHLEVGDRVKIWGTLRGDGVLMAVEIQAKSNGEYTWIVLDGRVTAMLGADSDIHANPNSGGGVGRCGAAAGDIHANPNRTSCPTFYVDGVRVTTDNQTSFLMAGGGKLDPASIRVGQHAYVEGWQKPGTPVRATTVKIG